MEKNKFKYNRKKEIFKQKYTQKIRGGINTPNEKDLSLNKLIDDVINSKKHEMKKLTPTRKRKYNNTLNDDDNANNKIKLIAIDSEKSEEKGILVEKSDEPHIEVVKDKNIMKDFVELNIIGRGGFGVVCTIKNKNDPNCLMVAKKVQIKRERKKYVGNPPQLIREIIDETHSILNEINILTKLKDVCNEYILCYNDFYLDKDNNIAYIVTEFLDTYKPISHYVKISFFNKIVSEVKSMEEYGSVLYQICVLISNMVKGLSLIHSNNIVHRDIKPDNILIDINTLKIKYIDFGLACDKNNRDSSCDIVVGTPIYIDPYYIENKNTDLIKVDYWGLGYTIFEIFFLLSPLEYSFYYLANMKYIGLLTKEMRTTFIYIRKFHEKYKSNLFNAKHSFSLLPGINKVDILFKINNDLINIAKQNNLAYIDFQNIFLEPEQRQLYGV